MTLKSGLGVVQGHCNSIDHCTSYYWFRDIARYLSKITIFHTPPPAFDATVTGVFVGILPKRMQTLVLWQLMVKKV